MISNVVATWFPTRSSVVLEQLKGDGLYLALGAPGFSQLGGSVPAGYNLEMSHTNSSGVIYFTTDGSDPRWLAAASRHRRKLTQDHDHQLPDAGARPCADWHQLERHPQYIFYPPQDLSRLLVTEIMYHPPAGGLIDGDEFEFLELKNAGTNTLTLGGLHFTSGITFTFTNGTTLPPGNSSCSSAM